MGIKIKGTGSYVPEKILTNADLEKMVDTSNEWIVTRTGIKERHIAADNEFTSDMAVAAAKRALEMAGIAPDELDLIIVATITPDMPFPSTAALVQQKIGAKPCVCMDVEAACSGLLYALTTAYGMMASPLAYKRALVIGAEKLSSVTDWSERSTCVLFGDGAAALVLENDGDPESGSFYIDGLLCADGNYADILRIPAGGCAMPASAETIENKLHSIKMGGPKTFQMAVHSMTSACQTLLERTQIPPEKVRWVIPHQANQRIITAVASHLAIPEKVYSNIDRFGNTSSASIGICLDELNRNGQLQKDDLVLAVSFGAGLTWAAMIIKW